MTGLTIATAVAALLEPDETLRAEVTNAEPVTIDEDTLYVWLAEEAYGAEDTGGSDRHYFVLGASWATDASSETDTRDRDTSEAIDTRVDAIARAVRGTRASTPYWEWLQVDRIVYDDTQTHELRGFEARLSGYVQDYSL